MLAFFVLSTISSEKGRQIDFVQSLSRPKSFNTRRSLSSCTHLNNLSAAQIKKNQSNSAPGADLAAVAAVCTTGQRKTNCGGPGSGVEGWLMAPPAAGTPVPAIFNR